MSKIEVEVRLTCLRAARISAQVGHLKDDPDFNVVREMEICDGDKILTRNADYIKDIVRKNLAELLPHISYYIAGDKKVPRLERERFIALSRLYSLLSCKPKTPDLPWE